MALHMSVFVELELADETAPGDHFEELLLAANLGAGYDAARALVEAGQMVWRGEIADLVVCWSKVCDAAARIALPPEQPRCAALRRREPVADELASLMQEPTRRISSLSDLDRARVLVDTVRGSRALPSDMVEPVFRGVVAVFEMLPAWDVSWVAEMLRDAISARGGVSEQLLAEVDRAEQSVLA